MDFKGEILKTETAEDQKDEEVKEE